MNKLAYENGATAALLDFLKTAAGGLSLSIPGVKSLNPAKAVAAPQAAAPIAPVAGPGFRRPGTPIGAYNQQAQGWMGQQPTSVKPMMPVQAAPVAPAAPAKSNADFLADIQRRTNTPSPAPAASAPAASAPQRRTPQQQAAADAREQRAYVNQ